MKSRTTSNFLLSTVSATLCITSAYLIFMLDPAEKFIEHNLKLLDGSPVLELWKKPPLELHLRVYVFNVTNHKEFLAGHARLNVEEIGPFVYQEIMENTEVTFNNNDTISYVPKRKVKFLPEHSIGDPRTFYVTVPNSAFLGITSMLEDSGMVANLMVNQLSTVLGSTPVLNMTVHDYLWGYNDPLIHLANRILPKWIPFKKFGLMDRMFDEGHNVVSINTRTNRVPQSSALRSERLVQYAITSWNYSPGLTQWGYQNTTAMPNEKCRLIEGAFDGTIFPRAMPKTSFRAYRKAFCRTLQFDYDHTGFARGGFHADFFKISNEALDTERNPDNICYCERMKKCLPRGLTPITECYYGIPTAVSAPHFYNADPRLLAFGVTGMAPDPVKHDTLVALSTATGIPVSANSRVQINLIVTETKYNKRTKPFNNMVIPLFWSELHIYDLETTLKLKIHFISLLPFVQLIIIAVLAATGIIVFFKSWFLLRDAGIIYDECPNLAISCVGVIEDDCKKYQESLKVVNLKKDEFEARLNFEFLTKNLMACEKESVI